MSETLQNGTPRVQSKIRFIDFMPDVDTIIPGALLDMSNLVPSAKGYRTYPRLAKYSINNLPNPVLGTYTGLFGDVLTVLAGTVDKLYWLNAFTLTDSGLLPGAPVTGRWRFDFYAGEVVIVNGIDPPYTYNGTTFANLAGSPPVASIVQATDYSLFLFPPNSADWISTLNSTLWTPSIATETVTGTIRRVGGNITAAHRLRGGIAIYKRTSLTFGRFTGPPFYWDFGNGVSDLVGAPGQESVANVGDAHYFPGPDDFYSFDGYSLQRIPNQLKEWFFATLDQHASHLIAARWDQKRSLIFWHFPSINSGGVLDCWICYDVRNKKWSADTNATDIDMPVFSVIPTVETTYDALTTRYPTYGAMNFMYGDLHGGITEISGAFRASDHALCLYNGQPMSSSFTMHDFGDRENLYQVISLKPHYEIYPVEGATIQPLNQRLPGTALTPGNARPLASDGHFNVFNTALLQRYKHIGFSEYEITGIDAQIEYAGEA
jgi:hypothetical protein